MKTALVLYDRGNKRSMTIGRAFLRAFRTREWKATIQSSWNGKQEADVVAAYGWVWQPAFAAHPNFIYADLGWWNRHPVPRQISGYHRISVNNRYEEPEPIRVQYPSDRWTRLGVRVKPWRYGPVRRVLVGGMSRKSAVTSGLPYLEWEREAVENLRNFGFDVVFRPKHLESHEDLIEGVEYSHPIHESVEAALEHVDAVVSHHSNLSVDALVHGIPAFSAVFPAAPFIFKPFLGQVKYNPPADRIAYLWYLSYRQWTPSEIEKGHWISQYRFRK